MSGGAFDYAQYRVHDAIEDIKKIISKNNDQTENEWGDPIGRGYSEDTIQELKKGVEFMEKAAIYMQRIDWLFSGDDGEETFHKRLKKELEEL